MIDLVTGATGFLGSALVRALVHRGSQVRALVRRTSDVSALDGLPIEVTVGGLEDRESLRKAVSGVTRIYHCAGVSTDWAPWESYYSSNVVGVRNLLEAASTSNRIERLLHVSTTDVYGYPKQPCTEDEPVVDAGLPYNRSKGSGESEVRRFAGDTGLPVTIVRPASVYGPRDPNFVFEIGRLLQRGQMLLIDGGKARAGLLYVDDAIRALIRAAESEDALGRTYNLQDGSNVSWRVFSDTLADALGVGRARLTLPEWPALRLAGLLEAGFRALRTRHRPFLTRHAVLLLSRDQAHPIERARSEFGFRPRVDLASGIEASVEWLKRTA